MARNSEIVVVGAGPVGLWTAIQIRKRAPDSQIRLYEQDTERQRPDILRIENLPGLVHSGRNPSLLERAFCDEVMDKSLPDLFYAAASGSVFIQTGDFQEALKTYAHALDIETAGQKIDHPQKIMDRHPKCRHFIAADGAASAMRKILMGEYALRTMPLRHAIEVKYRSTGMPRTMASLINHDKTVRSVPDAPFEYIGEAQEGRTPITLRFLVDRKTYDQVPQTALRDPLRMNDYRLPGKLRHDVNAYIALREKKAGDNYYEDSARIKKLTLSMAAAKQFAVMAEDRGWFLAGEAAMRVPRFRPLDTALRIGSHLGAVLANGFLSASGKVSAYNAIRLVDVTQEFMAARGKDQISNMQDEFHQAQDSRSPEKSREPPALHPAFTAREL